MAEVNWLDILGWGQDQIGDLRIIGYLYLREGKYQSAARYFEALAVLDPQNVYDLQTLGSLYMQTGQLDRALDFLNRALTIQPEDHLTLLNKAKLLLLLNQREEALAIIRILTRSSEIDVANEATALFLAYR